MRYASEDLLNMEIDLIELNYGCIENCSHCSESPYPQMVHTQVKTITQAVKFLKKAEGRLKTELFANYWYPFPASDPFMHPQLFEICDSLWKLRGICVYLLSTGWNRSRGERTAKALSDEPRSLRRVLITISNFPKLAQFDPEKHRSRLADSISNLQQIWDSTDADGKPIFVLSAQYIASPRKGQEFLSEEATMDVVSDVCKRASVPMTTWLKDGRIHSRPITSLGRAKSELGVKECSTLTIGTERHLPPISRFLERQYSGLITRTGELARHPGLRGTLGRHRDDWEVLPQEEDRNDEGC